MGVHFQSKCWVKWKSARKLIEKSAQYELGFHHSPWETAVSICHGTETVLCVVFLIFFFVTAKRWKFSWWTADFCPLSACLMLQRLSCEQMISVSVWESESVCVCVKVSGCCHQPPPSPPSHTHISNPVSWVLNQLSFQQCVLSVSHHTKQGDAVQERRASVCFLSWTCRRGFTPTPWPVTTEIKLNWLGGFSGGKWMQAAYSPCSFFFFFCIW